MRRGSLEVIEYVSRPVSSGATSPGHACDSEDFWSRLRLEHRTITSCAAALAALAIHLLLVAPVLWVGASSGHREEQWFRGDSADLQWAVLVDSSGRSADIGAHTASPTLRPIGVADALRSLPASLPAATSKSNGAQGLGLPYGRYLGQIHARIDRAWLRPRGAIGAPIFRCQVQVDQDTVGRVRDVTLLECNGGAAWRLSLVRAIEAASPLPAPSDAAVFVRHIILEFRAVAYSPAVSAQLYEPAARAVPASDADDGSNPASQRAFQTLRDAARSSKPAAVKLQIEGSKVEVESDRQ